MTARDLQRLRTKYEDEEASAKDLAEGISVEVWGEKSGDTLNVKAIRIIKVVF